MAEIGRPSVDWLMSAGLFATERSRSLTCEWDDDESEPICERDPENNIPNGFVNYAGSRLSRSSRKVARLRPDEDATLSGWLGLVLLRVAGEGRLERERERGMQMELRTASSSLAARRVRAVTATTP